MASAPIVADHRVGDRLALQDRWPARLAGEGGEAGDLLGGEGEGRRSRATARSGRTRTARPSTIRGFVAAQHVVAEPEVAHHPRREVLDDDVGVRDEAQEQPPPLVGREVERDARASSG